MKHWTCVINKLGSTKITATKKDEQSQMQVNAQLSKPRKKKEKSPVKSKALFNTVRLYRPIYNVMLYMS